MRCRGETGPELDSALGQLDRLQSTIDTLLAVARDAPRREAAVALAAVVDAAERRWRGALAAAGRPLRVEAPATPAIAHASPPVVSEVLDVLLENAHRHGAGTVRVAVRGAAGGYAVDVSDEGPGLPGGSADTMFARRSSGGNGKGIGLALAQSLAHAEGGRLTVTRAGPKPTFTLLLAAAPGRAPAQSDELPAAR